ncbi:MAG: DJ-1/PfpI family protein [Candidatus Symbiothrix sp.]|jgi:4-methyl-5(b-hydroxyethyl)-thiazole monophosphate biosynthesis|nr:DJ-1/PfpI family protein [Candidatus Symbiothrix sp.]
MKVFLFLATGFEEIEAIGTVDILRRGGLDVTTVSITDELQVLGTHNIPVSADEMFENVDFSSGDLLVLPGGGSGSENLGSHDGLKNLLKQYAGAGKKIAAICAAPMVLGGLGLLQGKRATCYPGYEETLRGATIVDAGVVKDGNIITGKGPGYTFDFALALVAELQGQVKAGEVAAGLQWLTN